MAFSDHTFQNAANATGDGSEFSVTSETLGSVQVSGTFDGTIVLEGSLDGGTTYSTIPARDSTGLFSEEITAVGLYTPAFPLNLLTDIRARISVYNSGTITVKGRFGP